MLTTGGLGAVSYTHLDVYKRQGLSFGQIVKLNWENQQQQLQLIRFVWAVFGTLSFTLKNSHNILKLDYVCFQY